MTNSSDEALFRRYVQGERTAFQILFTRYAPIITRLMRRDLSAQIDANDLVQQTFLQVHRARNDFDTRRKLRPWIITIALNVKRQRLRAYGRNREIPGLDTERCEGSADPQAPALIEASQTAQTVRDALARLPAGQREVITLHWLDGLPFPEIARLLGLKLSAVKVRAHRGYPKLRDRLRATKNV